MAAVVAGNGTVAAAAPPPVEIQTQRYAELGRRHFEHGRYQEAIVEYRKAYELKADPIFLYEIAGCYRQLGLHERALFFYERYQSVSPDARNRDEVDQLIADLERVVKNARATPTPNLPPPDRVLPPSEDTHLQSLSFDQRPPAAAAPPPWRRWWVWTALGVVAAGAATAAVMSSRGDAAIPTTELGNKRFY